MIRKFNKIMNSVFVNKNGNLDSGVPKQTREDLFSQPWG